MGLKNTSCSVNCKFLGGRDEIFAEKTYHDFSVERKLKPDLFFPDDWQPEDEVLNGDDANQDEETNSQPVEETYEDQFKREVAELKNG